MRPARDETTDNLVDTLKDMVAKDQLEPALEKIRVFTRKYGRIKDPDIDDIEKIAISNQANLSNLNRIQQTGQIAPEDAFTSGRGLVAANIQAITTRIEKLNEAKLNAQLIVMQSDDLDKIVKLLLVSVLLCTAIHFVYSLFTFNILKLSVSFVGATGSFWGYYNWRASELRHSN